MRRGISQWLWTAGVALAAAAGCSAVPAPTPITEDPVVQALAKRAPVRAAIAVAPPLLELATPGEHGGHYDWPVPAVQALAVESLTAARIAESVRPLPLAARGRAAGLTAAWDAGDDLLLEITITRCEARYLGTNGWYVPNLMLWIEFVWPAWFVADERYTVEIEGRATLTAVATGREVWTGRIGGSYDAALDDFDRGLVLLGTLRVPGALGDQNFRAIGDVLHPHAAAAWQRSLAVTTDEAFRRLITTPAYAEATRRTLGLLIGCGTYYDPGLTNLKFPKADVEAMEAWLRRAGADDRQLEILTDERATRAAILRSIREFLAKRARPGDRVVVHF
ncbi:MAG: caspase family protein, partial [Planctomycetota bacterium]